MTPILVSPSQLATKCSLAWRWQRLRRAHERGEHEIRIADCPLCCGWEPPPPRIATEFGSAVHRGIEEYLRLRHEDEGSTDFLGDAIAAARERLDDVVRQGVVWDDPPRLRRDGLLYRGDEARITDLAYAQLMAEQMVEGWVWRFGSLPVRDIEVRVDVPLAPLGLPEGTVLRCRLDITTLDGGLVDLKTSRDDWDRMRWDDKLDQVLLYAIAYRHLYGELPEYGVFHVAPKTQAHWQVVEVAVDEAHIEPVLERVVRPAVRMIEADAFLPNRTGPFPHSERWCDYWQHCPFGARAEGTARSLDLPLTPQIRVVAEGP